MYDIFMDIWQFMVIGFLDGVVCFKLRKNIIFRIIREVRVNVLCFEFNCQFRFLGIGLYFILYSNIDIFLLVMKVNCVVGCDLLKNLCVEKKVKVIIVFRM